LVTCPLSDFICTAAAWRIGNPFCLPPFSDEELVTEITRSFCSPLKLSLLFARGGGAWKDRCLLELLLKGGVCSSVPK
jgi:hypothetical protein